jgi:hypothetical protein
VTNSGKQPTIRAETEPALELLSVDLNLKDLMETAQLECTGNIVNSSLTNYQQIYSIYFIILIKVSKINA